MYRYQRVSKGLRTMGSEWPDKRDKTGFSSVARGKGGFRKGATGASLPKMISNTIFYYNIV